MKTRLTPKAKVSRFITSLRWILMSYKFWGESQSDSPFKIGRSDRIIIDERGFFSRDTSLRRVSDKRVPSIRTITTRTLEEEFQPLVDGCLQEVNRIRGEFANIDALKKATEKLEFYVGLYTAFNGLKNPVIIYVSTPEDKYVGFFLTGEMNKETIIVYALITQSVPTIIEGAEKSSNMELQLAR